MLKVLRRKFIAIAMASMAAVLILLIGAINIINYRNIQSNADSLLAILAQNYGVFPANAPDNKSMTSAFEQFFQTKRDYITAEAAFDTRYFTVLMDEDGTISAINTGKIHACSSSDAKEYASGLFNSGRTKGFVDNYRYMRLDTTKEEYELWVNRDMRKVEWKDQPTALSGENTQPLYMYIFLDCEQDLNTFVDFLVASILISAIGLFVVFVLVFIFSKKTLKPVAESYEKQKRFITDASHEIKTPLTIIDAHIEILEMMGEENEWTQSIRNQIRRLTQLTEKMVFLSRMDEENVPMQMLDFSLSDAVAETAEPFLAIADTTNRILTLDIAPNITFHGDEASIRQAVSLLLDNALKYASTPGEILVRLSASAHEKHLIVWNTVDEIEIGSHNRLFDRFYRRDESRSSQTGGSGIGLSVVQAIVAAHRGKISAKSADGKSICFSIHF